jgi:hypothetical protein
LSVKAGARFTPIRRNATPKGNAATPFRKATPQHPSERQHRNTLPKGNMVEKSTTRTDATRHFELLGRKIDHMDTSNRSEA